MNFDEIKYPIGRFKLNKNKFDTNYVKENIEILKKFPSKLEDEIKILDTTQINTPYREKGWTISQRIHHLADSHSIAYIRCKLAVNQNKISVNDYIPEQWANHVDAKQNNYIESLFIARMIFGSCCLSMMISIVFFIREIQISTKALKLHLSDMDIQFKE